MILSAREAREILKKEKEKQLSEKYIMGIVLRISEKIKEVAKTKSYLEYEIYGHIDNLSCVKKVCEVLLELEYTISIDRYDYLDDDEEDCMKEVFEIYID